MLLGAELYPYVLELGRLVGSINETVAMNTILGWIVMKKKTLSVHSPTDYNTGKIEDFGILKTSRKRIR